MHNLLPIYDQGYGSCEANALGCVLRKMFGGNYRTWLHVLRQKTTGADDIARTIAVVNTYGLVDEEHFPYTKENLQRDWNRIPKQEQDRLLSIATKVSIKSFKVRRSELSEALAKYPIVFSMPMWKPFRDYRGGLLPLAETGQYSRHAITMIGELPGPPRQIVIQNQWPGWGENSLCHIPIAYINNNWADIFAYAIIP